MFVLIIVSTLKIKDLMSSKTSPTRQSKKAIGCGLGLGLVWVSVSLISKEPMHSW